MDWDDLIQIEDLIRVVSGLAALMLVTAGVLVLRPFRIPGPILSIVRVFYAVLWPSPALFLMLFAALVVRARAILGFWPYPRHFDPALGPGIEAQVSSPLDPKLMPIHYGIVCIVLVVALFAILWAIPAYSLLRVSERRPHAATLSILVGGWTTLFLLPICDPGGFFSWYMD